jgi:hypothetical protein
VRRILAVQAQDPVGFRLALRSRTRGLTVADVDAALDDGSLVVGWLNRGTLHLVAAEDYWWLHRLTTPQLATSNRTRLRQEGVSPQQADRGVELVRRALAGGPVRRGELRALLDGGGVPTAGQAFVHVLYAAALEGHLVRGPIAAGGEQALVDPTTWIGAPPARDDEDDDLALLGHRYLAGHGPAEPADLAAWAGITLGRARRALAALGGPEADSDADVPAPVLLGPFDPVLHGWASREALVGEHRSVVTTNGLFRPLLLVGGRVVGTWSLARGRITLRPLERLPAAVPGALAQDARDVQRFLSLLESDPAVA